MCKKYQIILMVGEKIKRKIDKAMEVRKSVRNDIENVREFVSSF